MLQYFAYFILVNAILVKSFINIQENSLLETCLTSISEKYLYQHHTNVFLGPKFKEINLMFARPFKIGNSKQFLTKEVQNIEGSYTISYDRIEELNETLGEVGTSNSVHYIVITNNKKDLSKITEILWQTRLYKSVILLTCKSSIKLYAIDLKNSKCGFYIRSKKVNEYTNGRFKKALNLFNPDMKKNYRNCPIRIIWSKYSPWIFSNNDTESGIYRDILSIFQEKSGFTLAYMPESEVYSEELAYYNFGSIIADFDNDYADLFVGLVGFSASSTYVWTTNVIYQDSMYFVVPNLKIIPQWKLLFKLFAPSIWVVACILFYLLCSLFTVLALSTNEDRGRFGNFIDNIFYLYCITMYAGYYRLPRSTRMRIFLGTFILTSLVAVTVIQGKYMSFISKPLYEKRTKNTDQLVDSDMPIKFSEGLRLLFMFSSGNPRYQEILNRVEILPSRDLDVNLERAYNESFATVTDSGLLIMNPHLKNTMQVFQIYSFVTCFLVQKNYVLYEYITKNLTSIVESGFVEKFVGEMKFNYACHQFFKEEKRAVKLTVTHLEGPLFMLVGGYVLAFVTFVSEHLYFRCRTFICRSS